MWGLGFSSLSALVCPSSRTLQPFLQKIPLPHASVCSEVWNDSDMLSAVICHRGDRQATTHDCPGLSAFQARADRGYVKETCRVRRRRQAAE